MTTEPDPTAADPTAADPTAADPTAADSAVADASMPDASAAEVVRAEEQLRVGTLTRVRERVRLHKRVVTEEVTRTVTIAREVLDIEHLPADPTDEPASPTDEPVGPLDDVDQPTDIELVLHEERVTVSTVVVPVERVRVRITRITDQANVSEVLRREQIQVAPAPPADPRNPPPPAVPDAAPEAVPADPGRRP